MVYGVVCDGKLIYSGAAGYAQTETKLPVHTTTLFRIASISKSVTAMAILILRDEGKISLDEPVSKYLPEMKAVSYLTTLS